MRHLGVDANHLWVIEGADKGQRVSHRRQIDVAARLIGLGLHREHVAVALVDRVRAQEIQRLAQVLDPLAGILAGVRLRALAPAPENVDPGAELGAEVHAAHRLLQSKGADARVMAGEGAVAENGVREKGSRGHGHDHARGVERALELGHDALALPRCGAKRHEVVVVEVHTPGATLGQLLHDALRWKGWPHKFAKRIAPAVTHGPEPEREVILRRGAIGVVVYAHRRTSRIPLASAMARKGTCRPTDGLPKYRPEAPLRADTPIMQMRAEQGRWEGVAGERAVAAYNARLGGVPWHMLGRVRQGTAVERPDAQAR